MNTTTYSQEPLRNKLRRYPKEILYYFAGLYFTFFKKLYKDLGVTLKIPTQLTTIRFRGRFVFTKYEREEALFLNQYLNKDAKVLELGGCLGYISCITNKILNNPKQHVVLEANPKLIKWIEHNKKANDCHFNTENIVISRNRVNNFHIHPIIHSSSLNGGSKNAVEVKGVSIRELEQQYKFKFDTLILDIEGGELQLLRDHQEELIDFKQIFIELHAFGRILSKEEGLECESILAGLGFEKKLVDGHFQIWEK